LLNQTECLTSEMWLYKLTILLVLTQTRGVNFINVLRAAIRLADPKSAKNTVKVSATFALQESVSVKASRKMSVKLIPDQTAKINPMSKLHSSYLLILKRRIQWIYSHQQMPDVDHHRSIENFVSQILSSIACLDAISDFLLKILNSS